MQCYYAASTSEGDLSFSVKNGIMYLEDPVDQEWLPHFFVLDKSRLHYTEETRIAPEQDEDEDDDSPPFLADVRHDPTLTSIHKLTACAFMWMRICAASTGK